MTDYRFILRDDQPFDGTTLSVLLPDDTIAYTKGQTLEEYRAAAPYPVRVVTCEHLEGLMAAHEQSQVTEPEPETAEQYDYALGVLPPARYHRIRGVTLFHIAERLRGSLVEWHATLNGRRWSFVDVSFADSDYLAEKVHRAAEGCGGYAIRKVEA